MLNAACRCRAVEAVCREGPDRVLELVAMGAEFTRGADGELHLTREGGHTHRRIVHAADVTGREIERALIAAASAHPNIALFEHHLAVDLVTDEVRKAYTLTRSAGPLSCSTSQATHPDSLHFRDAAAVLLITPRSTCSS